MIIRCYKEKCMNSKVIRWFAFIAVALTLASCAAGAAQDAAGGNQQTGSSVPGTVSGEDAAALFQANRCTSCHGADRQGNVGPALLPDRLTKPASDYISTITDGKGGMPAFGNRLTPEQIQAIVTWLQTPLQ
jgi:mono/diheme cytochrome c family protein